MKRIPQLDGLRGVAILLVLLSHTDMIFKAGWIGVDLFFVLSGFLITGILLDTKDSPHWLRSFYIRRTKRIFPVYYATLIVMMIVDPVAHLNLCVTNKLFFVFLDNWKLQWGAIPGAGSLTHLWSLAIEEQFYLGWSLIVWRVSSKTLSRIAITGMLLGPSVRLFMLLHGRVVYFQTFCRMDTLLIGSLVAILIRTEPELSSRMDSFVWFCIPILYLLLGPMKNAMNSPLTFYWIPIFVVAGLGFAGVLIRAVSGRMRFLNFLPLKLLGRWSYGLYIYHIPINNFLGHATWQTSLRAMGVSILAAAVSFELLEKRLIRASPLRSEISKAYAFIPVAANVLRLGWRKIQRAIGLWRGRNAARPFDPDVRDDDPKAIPPATYTRMS